MLGSGTWPGITSRPAAHILNQRSALLQLFDRFQAFALFYAKRNSLFQVFDSKVNFCLIENVLKKPALNLQGVVKPGDQASKSITEPEADKWKQCLDRPIQSSVDQRNTPVIAALLRWSSRTLCRSAFCHIRSQVFEMQHQICQRSLNLQNIKLM